MSGRIAAILDQIEAQQREPSLPPGTGALELLQMVYRGELRVSPQQIRAAIEALPYENPKLSAMAVHHLTGQEFAAQLERAVERSNGARVPKLIEARAEPERR